MFQIAGSREHDNSQYNKDFFFLFEKFSHLVEVILYVLMPSNPQNNEKTHWFVLLLMIIANNVLVRKSSFPVKH